MPNKLNIYLKKKSDTNFTKVTDDATLPYALKDLDPKTDYQVAGSNQNAAGESPMNEPTDFTTKGVPAAPTIAAEAGDAQAALTITAPTDTGGSAIIKYLYRFKKTSDADWGDPVDNGNKLTATLTGLTNGTEYSIEAAAVNEFGQSAWDDNKAIHVTPTAPAG